LHRRWFILTLIFKKEQQNFNPLIKPLLTMLQRMTAMMATTIFVHSETSAKAASIVQCLTGAVMLLHNCMPTPPF
jgi:hypothetical protein